MSFNFSRDRICRDDLYHRKTIINSDINVPNKRLFFPGCRPHNIATRQVKIIKNVLKTNKTRVTFPDIYPSNSFSAFDQKCAPDSAENVGGTICLQIPF